MILMIALLKTKNMCQIPPMGNNHDLGLRKTVFVAQALNILTFWNNWSGHETACTRIHPECSRDLPRHGVPQSACSRLASLHG